MCPPLQATVFDYCLDESSITMVPWSTRVPPFSYAASVGGDTPNAAALFVHTVETVRLQYLVGLVMKGGHHAMLVGGSGKHLSLAFKGIYCCFEGLVILWALAQLRLSL